MILPHYLTKVPTFLVGWEYYPLWNVIHYKNAVLLPPDALLWIDYCPKSQQDHYLSYLVEASVSSSIKWEGGTAWSKQPFPALTKSHDSIMTQILTIQESAFRSDRRLKLNERLPFLCYFLLRQSFAEQVQTAFKLQKRGWKMNLRVRALSYKYSLYIRR